MEIEYRVLSNPDQSIASWPAWRVMDGYDLNPRRFAVGVYSFVNGVVAAQFREAIRLWESVWAHDLDSAIIDGGKLTVVTLTHDKGNTLTDRDVLLVNAIDNLYALMPSEFKAG
jgi:pterin-4a-carbinolamine dehydratase